MYSDTDSIHLNISIRAPVKGATIDFGIEIYDMLFQSALP